MIYGAQLVDIILPVSGIFWNSKLDEKWLSYGQKHMPIYGRMRRNWSFLAHILAKYQYFWTKPILYDNYNSFARFVQLIAGNILKCLFKAKNTSKKGQNRDYLSLHIFQSVCHQKHYSSHIFKVFVPKFWEYVRNVISMLTCERIFRFFSRDFLRTFIQLFAQKVR